MDLRTLVLGISAFCMSFLVGWWLNIGAMFNGPRSAPMRPVAAAAVPSTTGQGQPTTGTNIVVPVPVRSQRPSPSPAPSAKAPLANASYAKDLPSQKAPTTSRRSGFRFRRR